MIKRDRTDLAGSIWTMYRFFKAVKRSFWMQLVFFYVKFRFKKHYLARLRS